ncbi:hypothetical protein LZC95_36185 [Pendulispora brunnea]|uniref:Glycosyltransferase RgtA/B/C/D-like domain-containing protein n=1 Tax=Pendulispora brunnea TaxID=2905690 RepID=A0ABZ2K1E7_9BACT
MARILDRAQRAFRRVSRVLSPLLGYDRALYVLWAAVCTLLSARTFYGYMLKQTSGEWSAPLDDVFIHFDYARSTAEGHPFEWATGNGYSSGNTSLSYPFVLALGYLFGFHGERLMIWAAIVAAVSVFGVLLAARGFFLRNAARASTALGGATGAWMRIASFLLPPLFLAIGSLDWSLWSGMEVAFFLGTWACGLVAFFDLDAAENAQRARRAWLLGLAGAGIVFTRPEGAGTVAAFGLVAAWPLLLRHGWRGWKPIAGLLLRAGLPAVFILVVQTVANRYFTGEYSANGAIVKLAANNPFLTRTEKINDYVFNLNYAIFRNLEYHFTDLPAIGFLLPTLGLATLAFRETRRYGVLIWLQIALWLGLTAFNGQVRWQNERYTMPAVAWLLIAAALGASALVRRRTKPSALFMIVAGALAVQTIGIATRAANTNPEFRFAWVLALLGGIALAALFSLWPLRVACVAAALFFFQVHQEPNYRGQKWFFGRASRNIRDQHLVAGRWLAHLKPRRVLVGDAGALIYASQRPGLDIIGLGGYHALPFARAGVHGLPATLELIERMPATERPDVLAIYPTWWGVLPTWFSSEVLARFPVEGNVICGGYEDVIYRADWHLLGTGNRPRHAATNLRDEIDVADLVSETEHRYVFPSPAGGWTDMKILSDPADTRLDLFDGGRRISGGNSERFVLRHLTPGKAATLIVRSAPDATSHVLVRAAGADVAALDFTPSEGWVETAVEIPADKVTEELSFEFANTGSGDFVDYHVWIAQ